MKQFNLILLCLALFTINQNMHAQQGMLGIRLGGTSMEFANASNNVLSQGGKDSINLSNIGPRAGMQAGFFGRFSIDNIVYFQPELLFVASQNKIDILGLNDPFKKTSLEQNLYQVHIPINVGIKIGFGKFKRYGIRAHGGIRAVLYLNNVYDGAFYGYEDVYDSSRISYQYGGGLDLGRFLIDFNITQRLVGKEYLEIKHEGELHRALYESTRFEVLIGFALSRTN